MRTHERGLRGHQRRGVAAVLVMVCMVVLVGFAALTVDVGHMYNTRADLQRTADAAALAGAIRLIDNERLKGGAYLTQVIDASRTDVGACAGLNPVNTQSPEVDAADVTIGYLSDPTSSTELPDTSTPGRFNAVQVLVRKDSTANGSLDLFFAQIFGRTTKDLSATATAAFMDGVRGFRVDDETGNAGIIPLALKDTSWYNLLNGSVTTGDNYSYDPDTGLVSPGSDGINELNLYPGSGGTQLPPGNFGTVDIGSPSNSTADLVRQIRYGVNAADLAYFGGALELGEDGTLILNGDTGLSAGIKDDLEFIKGKARTIPIFASVSGPGNNANFVVVGFVGIRIMNVKLTGAMNSKNVIIQPAIVVDDSAIVGPAAGTSFFVYRPVALVR